MQSHIHTIDPTQPLEEKENQILRALILQYRDKGIIKHDLPANAAFTINLFDNNGKLIPYTFTLTHTISFRKRKHYADQDRFEVKSNEQALGKGSFGEVSKSQGFLSFNSENNLVYTAYNNEKGRVLKDYIDIDQDRPDSDVKREIDFSTPIDHLRTKPLSEYETSIYNTDRQDYDTKKGAILTMREFKGKDLKGYLKTNANLDVLTLTKISINLLRALQDQVHKYGIVHRDLKPENIFIDPNTLEINIIDYGLAKGLHEKTSAAGTPIYMAPELAIGTMAHDKADLYSMGIVLAKVWGLKNPADVIIDQIESENKARKEGKKLNPAIVVYTSKLVLAFPTIQLEEASKKNIDPRITVDALDYRPSIAGLKVPTILNEIIPGLTNLVPDNRMDLNLALNHFHELELELLVTKEDETDKTVIAEAYRMGVAARSKVKDPSFISTQENIQSLLEDYLANAIFNNKKAATVFFDQLGINAFKDEYEKRNNLQDINTKFLTIFSENQRLLKEIDKFNEHNLHRTEMIKILDKHPLAKEEASLRLSRELNFDVQYMHDKIKRYPTDIDGKDKLNKKLDALIQTYRVKWQRLESKLEEAVKIAGKIPEENRAYIAKVEMALRRYLITEFDSSKYNKATADTVNQFEKDYHIDLLVDFKKGTVFTEKTERYKNIQKIIKVLDSIYENNLPLKDATSQIENILKESKKGVFGVFGGTMGNSQLQKLVRESLSEAPSSKKELRFKT